MVWTRAMAFAAVLLLGASCLAAEQTSYAIVLNRGLVVGEEYDIECSVQRTQTLADAPPSVKPVAHVAGATLTARMKVAAVDPIGTARRMTLTIRKLVDGDGKELLAPGTQVNVQIGEKETLFTSKDGSKIDDAAATALGLRFYPCAESTVSSDDTYGSKVNRKIGESWPMNADLYRAEWIKLGWKIDAGNLTGQAKLEGLEKVGDVPMLRVTSTLDVKNGTPPDMPKEIRVVTSEVHMKFEAFVPVDVVSKASVENVTFEQTMHLQNTSLRMEAISELRGSIKETVTPVKP